MRYSHLPPLIVFCCTLLSGYNLHAQDTLWHGAADSLPYQLHVAENYNGYYVRVRAGIACFTVKRYRAAIPHFRKALLFNPGDEVAMNYLYLCYLYAERFEEAKKISRAFVPAQAELMRTASFPAVEFMTVEGGMKLSDSAARFNRPVLASVGLGHSVARRFSLFHNIGYFRQNESRFSVQQFQYYVRASIPLKHDLFLSAGAHYFNGQVRSVSSYTLPGRQPPPQPGQPPPSAPQPRLIERDTGLVSNSLAGALTLTRSGRLFNVSLGATAAILDTTRQYQLQAGICYFPFMNSRLAIGATVYQHTESGFSANELAIAPYASAYVSPKLFLTFTYLNNRGNNIIENTGQLVNNSIDYTSDRYGFSASWKILKKTWVYGLYSYEVKQHAGERFTYHYHLFLAGFKLIP